MNTHKMITLFEEKNIIELKHYLESMNEPDLVALLEELDEKELPLIFRILPKEKAAETFTYMDSNMQKLLINTFTDYELREVMSELFLDDAVDIIEEMPANFVKRILLNTDEETRKMINQILQYPKNSAGSIMTIEYVNLKKDMTVGEAIARIRKTGVDKETIYTCYVTDHRKLIGLVSVKDLLTSDDTCLINEIMETNIIYADTHEDKENVAKLFSKYDFLALPIVDTEGYLVGIVTVDDALDVMQDEATEDISKMAAINPSEASYFNTSIFSHAKNRIVWLLVLMLSATLTGTIIAQYEDAFATIPLLVSFIPMLMDTGGNCGSQSSTLVIRGLALDEINFKDFFKVVFKEFRISLLVSIILATVNGLRIFLMYKDASLSLVVALSLMFTVIMSKIIGCMLPLFAKKLKLDPAIMAAPLITTIVDTFSIIVYFSIATKILSL